MRKIYEISKVQTIVAFQRIDIDEHGGRDVRTNQIITYPTLLSLEQLKKIAESKIAPGETIEVTVAPEAVTE